MPDPVPSLSAARVEAIIHDWLCGCGNVACAVREEAPEAAEQIMAEVERELAECKEALRSAASAMACSMRSDEHTGAPYDEDMAQTLAACLRVLGYPDQADKWHRRLDRGVS